MKPSVPKISDAEWTVMKELWRTHPQTAGQIGEALAGKTTWGQTTIKTLITRLVAKQALGFVKQGREYLYSPLVSEEACVRAESSSFLRRVFDGALTPMLAAFLEREDLKPEELASLRELLEKKGGSHGAQ